MHCKFLKLTNGEDLIVQTEDRCETLKEKEFIKVIEPVLISAFRYPHGHVVLETYTMQPWIKMANSNVINIPTTSIIVATDVHESAEKQYYQYVEETNQRKTFKENPFASSEEEDDEETLEAIIQSLNDLDDEEDDDGTTRSRITLH